MNTKGYLGKLSWQKVQDLNLPPPPCPQDQFLELALSDSIHSTFPGKASSLLAHSDSTLHSPLEIHNTLGIIYFLLRKGLCDLLNSFSPVPKHSA